MEFVAIIILVAMVASFLGFVVGIALGAKHGVESVIKLILDRNDGETEAEHLDRAYKFKDEMQRKAKERDRKKEQNAK